MLFHISVALLQLVVARAAPRACSTKSAAAFQSSDGVEPTYTFQDQAASTDILVQTGAATSSSTDATSTDTAHAASTDCGCGYVLSAYNNSYFPLANVYSFASLPDGPLQSGSDLADAGFTVTEGTSIGGVAHDGTGSVGTLSALSVGGGALKLTVDGGQGKSSAIKGAEIVFDGSTGLTGGVFTVEAQYDGTSGTCQAIFTYHQDDSRGDEQDIEVLGHTIFPTPGGPTPGIQLNNWDPSGSSKNDLVITPFPSDPTVAFHNYTLAWLPTGGGYFFDGQALKSPSKYYSVNPSNLIINHWTNGDRGFSQGPPQDSVTLKVKSVAFYYQTADQHGLPAGCALEDACRV